MEEFKAMEFAKELETHRLETMELETALTIIREKCFDTPHSPHDDHAWDLRLQDGERFDRLLSMIKVYYILLFQKDDFIIVIRMHATSLVYEINIEIHFPWYFCFFNECVDTLRYNNIKTRLGGFNAIHVSLDKRKKLIYSAKGFTKEGPAQAMTMARQFIQTVRHLEQKAAMRNARQRLAVFEQELLCKALHPRRVAQWILQGFDPFS
jgi:hypothetical protein